MSGVFFKDIKTVDDYIVWGDRFGLPRVPATFMPEFRTVEDPVTGSLCRLARLERSNAPDVERGVCLLSRNQMNEGVTETEACGRVDPVLRSCIWYLAEASNRRGQNHELDESVSGIVGEQPPAGLEMGEDYHDTLNNLHGKAFPNRVFNLETLKRWMTDRGVKFIDRLALEDIPEGAPRLLFGRHRALRRNASAEDKAMAAALLCREFGNVFAGFCAALPGHVFWWRFEPEIKEQTDPFRGQVMCLYARMGALREGVAARRDSSGMNTRSEHNEVTP